MTQAVNEGDLSRTWTDAEVKAHLIMDAIESFQYKIRDHQDDIDYGKAKIIKAQAQVDRFDNWWGRITGQHFCAVEDLEELTEFEEGKAQINQQYIDEEKAWLESHVRYIQEHGMNIPPEVMADLEREEEAYNKAQAEKVESEAAP